MVLLQGRNFAAFEHPWSTMVSIASYLFDGGKSVMRSMEMYWNGPCSTWVSKWYSGARFHVGVNLVFLAFCASFDVVFVQIGVIGVLRICD